MKRLGYILAIVFSPLLFIIFLNYGIIATIRNDEQDYGNLCD